MSVELIPASAKDQPSPWGGSQALEERGWVTSQKPENRTVSAASSLEKPHLQV